MSNSATFLAGRRGNLAALEDIGSTPTGAPISSARTGSRSAIFRPGSIPARPALPRPRRVIGPARPASDPVQRQHGVHGFPGADRLSSQPIRPGQTVAADKSKDRLPMSMVRTRTQRSCRSSYSQNRPMIGGSSRPLPSNPLSKFTNDEKALSQSYFSTGCWCSCNILLSCSVGLSAFLAT